MSDIINQNTEPLFIFDMPDDETLSETISVKGEKGERGDPTKLSQLDNDTGFITKNVSDLTNYYSKSTTDGLLDAKLDKTTFNGYEIPSDFFTGVETVSGTGNSITLSGTADAIFKNISIYGDTSQTGTPTPSDPIEIKVAKGAQTVTISDGTNSKVLPINLGKNLYDGTIEVVGQIIGSDGTYTPSGTGQISALQPIEPNKQYTISWVPNSTSAFMRLCFYTDAGEFISRTSKNNDHWTFTTPSNAYYYRLSYAKTDKNVQVEEGANASDYAAYFEPYEMCALGDISDVIFKNKKDSELYDINLVEDAWYIRKNIGSRTFTGSESWFRSGRSTTTVFVGALNIGNTGVNFTYRGRTIETHGTYVNSTTMPNGTFDAYNNSNGVVQNLAMSIAATTAEDIDEFKAWVATAKPTFYFVLATPTSTRIEEPQLIEQLEALYRSASFTGTTIITTSGNLAIKLSATAYKQNWNGVTSGINNGLDTLGQVASGSRLGVVRIGDGLEVSPTGEVTAEVSKSAINALQSGNSGLIGISRDSSVTTDYYVLYSPDGEKFYQCGEKMEGGFSDASSLIEIKGRFYYFGSNLYRVTDDFVTWQNYTTINSTYDRYVWANTAYYDAETDTVYIYGAYQYNDDTLPTPFGGTTYYFKIAYQTATINADGTLNIDPTVHDLIYDEGETYIDPYVVKDPYLGFIIAYKNEATSKVSVCQMSSPTTVSGTPVECPAVGIEAPQLVSTPLGVICYVDGYALHNQIKTGIENMPGVSAYFVVSYKNTLMPPDTMGLVPISAPMTLRHLGLMPCTGRALYCAQQLGIKAYPPFPTNSASILNGLSMYSTRLVESPTLVNFPYALYTIPVSKTVTIKLEFKNEPLRLYIQKGVTVTWGDDSTIQSSCKGKTYTPTKDEILTLYADSVHLSSSMWVPYDRT